MKWILKLLLIFPLTGFDFVQASDDYNAFHGVIRIKPRPKRSSPGSNPGHSFGQKFQAQDPKALKSCRICGLSSVPKNKAKVDRGQEVDPPFKYPWKVALKGHGETFCGGAILNENFIMTAAHCLANNTEAEIHQKAKVRFKKPQEVSVEFVTSDATKTERGPPVERLIPHPQFSFSNVKYDIALLKLRKKITCNKFKNPICLPSENFKLPQGHILTVAGWGSEGGRDRKMSKVLKEAKIEHVNFRKCERKFPKDIQARGYCLVGVKGQAPCAGDSGGPMFSKFNKKYYAIGVASLHSSQTCEPEAPFIFTKVPMHLQWIQKTMGSSFPGQKHGLKGNHHGVHGRNNFQSHTGRRFVSGRHGKKRQQPSRRQGHPGVQRNNRGNGHNCHRRRPGHSGSQGKKKCGHG